MIIKFAFRNIVNNQNISIIKIAGLVIGFIVILYMFSWVGYEISYDKHFSKADRIYRFTVEQVNAESNFYWHFARTWQPWRKSLPDYFPEIEEMVELRPLFRTYIKIGQNKFSTQNAFSSDSSVFKVFDIEILEGDPIHALDASNTVIISRSYASKYFQNVSPLNKSIEIERNNAFSSYTITGVFEDIPSNTHFDIDILVNNFNTSNQIGNDWAYTYILLKEGSNILDIQSGIPGFMKLHIPEDQQKMSTLHFMPVTDIHLRSNIEREIQVNGNSRQVRFFIIVAIGIFIMVIVNYISLNSAIYVKRISTFSMNRILGAKQKHNILSLLFESFIITLVALIISLAGYSIFETFSIQTKTLNERPFILFIASIIIITFVVTVFSGCLPLLWSKQSYKFFFLHSKSVPVLGNRRYKRFNYGMLIIQFSISIVVVVSSLVMTRQNHFLLKYQLGKGDDQLISIVRSFAGNVNGTVFVDELKKQTVIEDVTGIFENPTYLIKDMRIYKCNNIPENKQGKLISICPADYNFFSFFNISLVAGKYLEPYQEGQKYMHYVLNEKAVKSLGYKSAEDAVGSEFQLSSFNNDIPYGGYIVGVVKNFHFSSLYHPIEATAYFQIPKYYGAYIIKVKPDNEQMALDKAQQIWNRFFPDYPFEYKYLSDVYKESYKKDLEHSGLINLLAFLSILISSIGLIGITSILLVQKTKEIGVHKVSGARVSQIISMLNIYYIKWIIIAFIIATPVAYYFMNNWLNNFAYKISLSWWAFVAGGIMVLMIAVLTVCLQSWKTARKNPVEALRYE